MVFRKDDPRPYVSYTSNKVHVMHFAARNRPYACNILDPILHDEASCATLFGTQRIESGAHCIHVRLEETMTD